MNFFRGKGVVSAVSGSAALAGAEWMQALSIHNRITQCPIH
ncbi:hypothetical protein [Anabaena sp. UHCC 0399]|nr:hypothetical protein [Anabaena sp. UHCC 0399]MEA5567872.1 hypothetical protein [Anabaena sp. UHCC 0399]